MTDQDGIRRARRALEEALAADAVEHPGYEAIEAYVDGKLDAAERHRIEQLAAQSSIVAEDIADLEAVRRALGEHSEQSARSTPVRGRNNIRWAGILAAAAASFVAAVWLGTLRHEPAPAPSLFAGLKISAEERTAVDHALGTGTLNVPAAVIALAGKQGMLLGPGESRNPFSPLTPTATAVLTTRPVFEWSSGNADSYTITVFDDTFTEVTRGTHISGTSWTPTVDLPRGATYQWQVTAHRASGDVTVPVPPRPEARFSVVDAQTAETVRGQRERLSNQPLALGVMLAEAGLLIDAKAELQRALEIPATAEAAKKLLESLSRDQGTPTTTKPAQ